jgi:hypothetical protein
MDFFMISIRWEIEVVKVGRSGTYLSVEFLSIEIPAVKGFFLNIKSGEKECMGSPKRG